jgi:rhodanese-related sulfurtransferase
MKNKIIHSIGFVCLSVLTIVACNSNATKETKVTTTAVTENKPKTEADLLLDYLAKTGDYVNSRQFPSMIKVPTVLENLEKKMLIIDIRSAEMFKKGHIKGARNIEFSKLPDYFVKEIKPFQFDKIVLVCQHGQKSGYATALLRLMGYGNVYSMRWGMAAWNTTLAGDDGWKKIISDKYASQLDTVTYKRAATSEFPDLKTGKKDGDEIFKERVKILFEQGFPDVMLSADQVFASKNNFYIVNYDRKDKYESGHIPGAIRYKPNGLLGIASEMLSLPANKDLVVYCETGQNSAFVAAYLRLFGYKAHTLVYGNNSFMYDKMKKETALGWNAFTPDQGFNNPVVK